MKVLFISSGNSFNGISPIVKQQGESLIKEGVNVKYYTIKGKGFKGYLKAIILLKKYIKQNSFDIAHAHYSLSGFVATIAGVRPLVVSLMGSDIEEFWWSRVLIKILKPFFWDACIIKSERLKIKDSFVVSNGVDIELFKPLDRETAKNNLGWDKNKKHILFPASPERYEKNFRLFKESLEFLNNSRQYELHFLKNIPHETTLKYFNAADVVVLTSLWEGSPNVIKEAMACNTPIVSTDVGDVKWVLRHTEGCYITSFDPVDVAKKLTLALQFVEKRVKTNGRERIIKLGLDEETIAKKIIFVYNEILQEK